MADAYTYETASDDKPPAITLLTVIGILFVGFIIWQAADRIDTASDRVDTVRLQEGDTFRYDHVARYADDDSLYATSEQEVAIAANRATGYAIVPEELQPSTAVLDENFTWGEKAAEALEGRFVGETVRIRLDAQEGPFALAPFNGGQGIGRIFFEYPVQDPVVFTQGEDLGGGATFDIDSFLAEEEAQLERPIVDGERIDVGYSLVPYHLVYDIDRDAGTLTIHTDIQDGRTYPVQNMSAEVTTLLSESGETVRFRLDMEEGDVFTLRAGDELLQELRGTWINIHRQDIWRAGTYQVQEVTEDAIHLGYTSNLDPENIGRALVLDITILSKGADTAQQQQ